MEEECVFHCKIASEYLPETGTIQLNYTWPVIFFTVYPEQLNLVKNMLSTIDGNKLKANLIGLSPFSKNIFV